MNLTDLLGALAGVPRLDGARCVGRATLFDPQRDRENWRAAAERHQAAQAICRDCPALARCRDWLDGLPKSDRPPGVVAAQLLDTPTTNPRKETRC